MASVTPWTEIDWGAHQRWVWLDTGPVNVIEMGSGPPVLMVHGLGGCWQNWLENIAAFADAGHRVIAMDLPGFGASPLPSGEVSITGYARALDALCTALEVEGPVAVIGNSMGGFVSAELALVAPERVERLVLVAAAGLATADLHDDRTIATVLRLQNVVSMWGTWSAARAESFARRPGLRKALLRMVAAHPERLSPGLAAEQLRGSGKPGFFPALQAILDFGLRDRLEQIVCPTFVVWGEKDQLVPLRDASEFTKLIDGARKVAYEDIGHVPMLECPERFNADVLAFLHEQPDAG